LAIVTVTVPVPVAACESVTVLSERKVRATPVPVWIAAVSTVTV
jgi:hypothetical protein